MQNNVFIGNLASAPSLTGSGDRAVVKFTLIANEYAGKDEAGNTREKSVAIQFTAFRGKAEAIQKHCSKGDQLIVSYRIENNRYTDKSGEEVYGYNFLLDDFTFGAPGKAKREELGQPPASGPDDGEWHH